MTTFIDKSHPETHARPGQETDETVDGSQAVATTQEETREVTGHRYQVPGDVVNQATQNLPDEERSLVRWFHAHGCELNVSNRELATKIGYSPQALSMVFNGKYPHSIEPVVDEIRKYKALYELRQTSKKLPFIKTAMSKKIWQICDVAREFSKIGFIYGESQVGKTAALEAYTEEHNHGSTVYVRMAAGGSTSLFLWELAKQLRMTTQMNMAQTRDRIFRAFDDRMLLIVDECHLCLYKRTMVNHPMDFIRELHDRTKCAVVLCGTKAFREELERGQLSKMFRQVMRRRISTLVLPDLPTRDDLNAFSAAYGLAPSAGEARKLENLVIEREALGMWLTLLRSAAKFSARQKVPMTWEHVQIAHREFQKLEGNL
jgi:DNA transposition AAA+ family ATPase